MVSLVWARERGEPPHLKSRSSQSFSSCWTTQAFTKQGNSVKVENRQRRFFASGRTQRDVHDFFWHYQPSLPDAHLYHLYVWALCAQNVERDAARKTWRQWKIHIATPHMHLATIFSFAQNWAAEQAAGALYPSWRPGVKQIKKETWRKRGDAGQISLNIRFNPLNTQNTTTGPKISAVRPSPPSPQFSIVPSDKTETECYILRVLCCHSPYWSWIFTLLFFLDV